MNSETINENSSFLQKLTSDNFILGSLIIAVLFALIGVFSENTYLNGLTTILTAFFTGYAVNRYTEMFKNQDDTKKIATQTAESLFVIIKEIIERSNLKEQTTDNELTILKLCGVIKSLEQYHKVDLEPLRGQQYIKIEEGKTFYNSQPSGSFNELPLVYMDAVFYHFADARHTANSGSNWRLEFQRIKEESSNKFMSNDVINNEQPFNQPNTPVAGSKSPE